MITVTNTNHGGTDASISRPLPTPRPRPTPPPRPVPTITVINTGDSGPGSLRQALIDAGDSYAITFAVTGTITLTSGELVVNKNVTVSGPGANLLTVSRASNAPSFRIFKIMPGHTVTIEGLTIMNGDACCIHPYDLGGGMYNDHTALTLSNCIISGNFADSRGGGLYNDGSNGNASAQIEGCVFLINSSYAGGAIFNNGDSGSATLELT